MKCLHTLGIIAIALTFGSVAMAYPTLNAETGIVALPNAFTAESGSVVGAADLLFSDDNTIKVRVLYGLNDHFEMGASLSVGAADGISVSAKYRFTDAPARLNFAAGGSLTLADHDQTALDMYLVGTQSIPLSTKSSKVLLGTFGVHFINVQGDNSLRPFIGAQYPLADNTEIAAEYQLEDGKFFQEPLTSVALRHQFTPSWTGQVGISNATGFGSTRDYRLLIGAQYTFSPGK